MSIVLQQHTWEAFISSFTAVSLHRNMVGTLQFFFTAVLFIIFRNQIVLLSSYPEKTVCFSVWFGYPSITKYLAMKTYLAKSTRHLDTVPSPAITLFPHWSVNNTRAYNCTHDSISVQVPSPQPFTWHTSFEESSRAKKCYITFDTDFWRYLPSQSIIGGSMKWSIANFCSRAKVACVIG